MARGTQSEMSDDATCMFVGKFELVLPTTTSWLASNAACMLCTVATRSHCFVNLTCKYAHVSKKTVPYDTSIFYVKFSDI